ncbi:tetratricopeptide repeat protein [Hyunsoonleella flava]|uniref:histidine kinase n=1 Tax=Hyunsoonleella flava TaxID=2527939 RepID=A0A4Q9FB66_9FLAO|nr:sensor histidine kinase [Hyunsoonleella flava]TBN00869.1 tetratricopeptide repeat protein [Hyunsoonleella flava]
MKNKLLFILCFLTFISCFSQQNLKLIDSLKQFLKTNPNDSVKIKTYSDLCWYYGRVSNDSAFHYGTLALDLSKKTNNKVGEAQAYNDLGIIYTYTSDFKTSMQLYKKALNIRKTLNDSMGIASIYNKMCYVYHKTFQMDSCLTYNLKALDIYSALGSKQHVFLSKGNIAAVYESMKQYDNALKFHFETLELSKEINDSLGLANIYLNIGNTYLSKKDTITGVDYYKRCMRISELNGYDNTLAVVCLDYGVILESQKKYGEALKLYKKSYELSEKTDDAIGMTNAMLNLGNMNTLEGNYKDAKTKLYQGLKLAKMLDSKEDELKAYEFLLHYYSKRRNSDSVIHYYVTHRSLKDSIYSNRVTKEIADVQEKYNTAEREKEIQSQRADIAEKQLNINKKNTQLIGLGLVAVLLSILGYLLYNQQKLKNRQLQKEAELKEAIARIETQNKLQEQRLRISRDLHDNIGAQLTFVISSIENLQYGFKIKNEKLTDKLKGISAFTKDTIYELRDTIWAMNKSEISIEDLEVRISNFVEKANEHSKDVSFKFNVSENVSKETIFTSVKGMNIYRIIQESINNALKYAHANHIGVSMNEVEGKLNVQITDDGKGFNVENIEQGNGLNNMKKRAKEINAKIKIESAESKGTSVTLVA